MDLSTTCKIELPDWIPGFLEDWQQPLSTISQRMQLAIALSEENIRQETGGPFAAIVVREETGELVSVGINLVTSAGLSLAHAEIVALSLAQSTIGEWNLSHAGRLQLITSCEPCAMCFGAVPWSGVKSMSTEYNESYTADMETTNLRMRQCAAEPLRYVSANSSMNGMRCRNDAASISLPFNITRFGPAPSP